jgi:hypothetical protein
MDTVLELFMFKVLTLLLTSNSKSIQVPFFLSQNAFARKFQKYKESETTRSSQRSSDDDDDDDDEANIFINESELHREEKSSNESNSNDNNQMNSDTLKPKYNSVDNSFVDEETYTEVYGEDDQCKAAQYLHNVFQFNLPQALKKNKIKFHDPNYKWLLKELNFSSSKRVFDVTELIEDEGLKEIMTTNIANTESSANSDLEDESKMKNSSKQERSSNTDDELDKIMQNKPAKKKKSSEPSKTDKSESFKEYDDEESHETFEVFEVVVNDTDSEKNKKSTSSSDAKNELKVVESLKKEWSNMFNRLENEYKTKLEEQQKLNDEKLKSLHEEIKKSILEQQEQINKQQKQQQQHDQSNTTQKAETNNTNPKKSEQKDDSAKQTDTSKSKMPIIVSEQIKAQSTSESSEEKKLNDDFARSNSSQGQTPLHGYLRRESVFISTSPSSSSPTNTNSPSLISSSISNPDSITASDVMINHLDTITNNNASSIKNELKNKNLNEKYIQEIKDYYEREIDELKKHLNFYKVKCAKEADNTAKIINTNLVNKLVCIFF